MYRITQVPHKADTHNREACKYEEGNSPLCKRVTNIAEDTFAKYPLNSTVSKLNSTFEIKQVWLYNEWAPECQFSNYIRPNFPRRSDLDIKNPSPNTELIQSTFHAVRGQYALWQSAKEEGRWKKVEVPDLKLDWVMKNVEVFFPSKEQFEVTELKGIVLWKDKKSDNAKKYQLCEGNHRISAWLAVQTPKSLPAVIFIGKPAAADPSIDKT